MPRHLHLTGAGVDQAAEHLQRDGLAGTIGAEKAHHLARLNPKGDVLHRHHIPGAAANEMAQGSDQPGLLLGNPIGLAEELSRDCRFNQGGTPFSETTLKGERTKGHLKQTHTMR